MHAPLPLFPSTVVAATYLPTSSSTAIEAVLRLLSWPGVVLIPGLVYVRERAHTHTRRREKCSALHGSWSRRATHALRERLVDVHVLLCKLTFPRVKLPLQ